jgi:hypothetical protein
VRSRPAILLWLLLGKKGLRRLPDMVRHMDKVDDDGQGDAIHREHQDGPRVDNSLNRKANWSILSSNQRKSQLLVSARHPSPDPIGRLVKPDISLQESCSGV